MRSGLTVMALFALGCSVLVEPGDQRVRCAVEDGVDPCPAGERCAAGFCTPGFDAGPGCMDVEIGCNGMDDDCDGVIDEGSDVDGDGFTWCDENPALRDCRDDNSAIHPARPPDIAAPEDLPCDGADNDCDGVEATCPAGQVCDRLGECRVPDCTTNPAFCGAGTRCEQTGESFQCVVIDSTCPSTPCTGDDMCVDGECLRPLGAGCDLDAQCESQLCVQSAALGLQSGNAPQVCSRTCCEDTDCPSGSRCWASGTGARGCVPDAILAAGPAGSPTGEACASNAECANECALRTNPGYDVQTRQAYICGDPVGSSTVSCGDSSECRSGLCISYCDSSMCSSFCSRACGSTDDCLSVDRCGWLELLAGGFVQTCLWGQGSGGRTGSACSEDRDCRDAACIGNVCADACCADSDCGPTYRCRPVRSHGRFEMLCQPR